MRLQYLHSLGGILKISVFSLISNNELSNEGQLMHIIIKKYTHRILVSFTFVPLPNFCQIFQSFLVPLSINQKLGAFVEEVNANGPHAKWQREQKGQETPGREFYTTTQVVRKVEIQDPVCHHCGRIYTALKVKNKAQ